eukprot:983041-Prorocentrum_minimum.AAC.1
MSVYKPKSSVRYSVAHLLLTPLPLSSTICSRGGPIRCRKRRSALATDQSDTGSREYRFGIPRQSALETVAGARQPPPLRNVWLSFTPAKNLRGASNFPAAKGLIKGLVTVWSPSESNFPAAK